MVLSNYWLMGMSDTGFTGRVSRELFLTQSG